MIVHAGRWQLDADASATGRCYAPIPLGSGCDCAECRNFIASVDSSFPDLFRSWMRQMSVDLRKPSELCHYGRDEAGLFVTHGWYHMVGSILDGRDAWTPSSPTGFTGDMERLQEGFDFGFSHVLLLVPETFTGHPVVQIEFATVARWCISDPRPS